MCNCPCRFLHLGVKYKKIGVGEYLQRLRQWATLVLSTRAVSLVRRKLSAMSFAFTTGVSARCITNHCWRLLLNITVSTVHVWFFFIRRTEYITFRTRYQYASVCMFVVYTRTFVNSNVYISNPIFKLLSFSLQYNISYQVSITYRIRQQLNEEF